MTFPKSYPSEPSEALPLDVLPCSNCEFIPAEPTREQRAIMCVAEEECEGGAPPGPLTSALLAHRRRHRDLPDRD